MRLNHDAVSKKDILTYFKTRRLQLLAYGYELIKLEHTDFGAVGTWLCEDKTKYYSIYLKPEVRGKGLYPKLAKQYNPILTVDDCHIADYLKKKNIPHKVIETFIEKPEYLEVSDFYKDQTAKRSGVYLMNHVDEALIILYKIGASEDAMKAFCLHPIIQSDLDFSNNAERIAENKNLDSYSIILAMEYRAVANAYLSTRKIKALDEIKLSPLKEVNDMLIADKIQNYKDFKKYHAKTHPRSKELEKYFKNWFKKLNISDELYKTMEQLLRFKAN